MFKYDLSAFLITCYPQYVEEWLAHYISVGVEHFYISDNDESRETYERIKPYIKDGLVDYEYHSKYFRECYLLQRYLKNYGSESRWFIKLDNDEFIFPETHSTILEEIDKIEWLHSSENKIGVIHLDWIEFNDPKAITYENKLMMERFKFCTDYRHRINPSTDCRCILNPQSFDYTYAWDHMPVKLKPGYEIININGEKLTKDNISVHGKLLLHHYRYRSLEEYTRQRLNVKNIYNGEIYTKEDIQAWKRHVTPERFCIRNDLADRFIPRVYEVIDYYRNLK